MLALVFVHWCLLDKILGTVSAVFSFRSGLLTSLYTDLQCKVRNHRPEGICSTDADEHWCQHPSATGFCSCSGTLLGHSNQGTVVCSRLCAAFWLHILWSGVWFIVFVIFILLIAKGTYQWWIWESKIPHFQNWGFWYCAYLGLSFKMGQKLLFVTYEVNHIQFSGASTQTLPGS